MALHNNHFYVITGGPGVGKTTLLDSLKADGYIVIPEAAREIIKEQTESNGEGVPWKDNHLYTKLMMERSIEDYINARNKNNNGPVFFDRGIPDSLCHWEISGNFVSEEMEKPARNYRYNQTVFIMPPWKEIYHPDNERKQNWKEAEYTYHKMIEIYKRYGYGTIVVPTGTIENRTQFILNKLKR